MNKDKLHLISMSFTAGFFANILFEKIRKKYSNYKKNKK